jgi:predicted metal-dependent hydrolase
MSPTHCLEYGSSTICYELDYAPRKTLAISVHPDLRVTVKAPAGSSLPDIEDKVRQRADWILKQQRELEIYLPHLPPRQYVSGETHRYLGRQYRLKVIESGTESVKLTRGFITVGVPDRADADRVRRVLEDWYRGQAQQVFQERLDTCFPRLERFGARYPGLEVRVMKSRWGSTSPAGVMRLNVKLVKVPKTYIDYVIFHELCHLLEPNHSPRYYELLDRILPDWRERRERLNTFEFG